jgi:hypothetical protein
MTLPQAGTSITGKLDKKTMKIKAQQSFFIF